MAVCSSVDTYGLQGSVCGSTFLQNVEEEKSQSTLQKNKGVRALDVLITETIYKGLNEELAATVKKCLSVDESFIERDYFHFTFHLEELARHCAMKRRMKESEAVINKVVSIRKKFGDPFANPLLELARWLMCYRSHEDAEKYIAEAMGSEMFLLRIVHARFHRTRIDEFKQEDGFKALNGFHYHLVTFNHFLGNDLIPAKDLLQEEIKNSSAEKKLSFIKKTIRASIKVCHSDLNVVGCDGLSSTFAEDIKSIPENERLLIGFPLPGHMTFFEFKKKKGVLYAKLYNSGAGIQLSPNEEGKFVVPKFTISRKSIDKALNALSSVNSTLIRKLEGHGEEAWVSFNLYEYIKNAITQNGGTENTTFYEAHRLQDRGNCEWKGFSTWIHRQCERVSVLITEAMIQRCREKYPYFEQSLTELLKEGKPVLLHRFMKMISYEKVRSKLCSLFSVSLEKDSVDQIQEKVKAKAPVYAKTACELHLKESGKKVVLDEKGTELYIFSLATSIIQNSAVARYQKKG